MTAGVLGARDPATLGLGPKTDVTTSQYDVDLGSTNLLHFALGALLVMDGQYVSGVWLPYSIFLVVAALLIAVARPPVRRLGSWQWTVWVFAGLLLYVTAVSITMDPTSGVFTFNSVGAFDWTRRVLRITLVIVFAFFIATQRLQLSALIRGLGLGLIVNAVAHYLEITPHTYGGLLTGWLADKNRAGLYYAVGGVLVQAFIKRPTSRVIAGVATLAAIWATGSRTSLIAFTMAMAWVWFISRQIAPLRWLVGGGFIWLAQFWEENYARIGAFADREGTDWFRARIDAASQLKLEGTPFQGLGLGEAYVNMDGDRWLFHNSYWTLLVEGGWVYCVGIVGLLVIVGLRPFYRGTISYPEQVAQGATVALMVCAWKLGEVFLTIPWALVFGMALNVLLQQPRPHAEDENLDHLLSQSAWRLQANLKGDPSRA